MFCSHCGNQTANGVKICPICSQDVLTGDNYCTGCGQVRLPGDEKCINCGAELTDVIRLAEQRISEPQPQTQTVPPPITQTVPPPVTQTVPPPVNQSGSGPKYLADGQQYCRHCGLIINVSDSKCPFCETPFGQGSEYCPKCGSGTIASDQVCSVCSAPLLTKAAPSYIPSQPPAYTQNNANTTRTQQPSYNRNVTTNVNVNINRSNGEEKPFTTTLLLCLLPLVTGINGAHRLYTGHIFIGILQLITFGGCGIWQLIDLIMIITDSYTDSDGRKLKH